MWPVRFFLTIIQPPYYYMTILITMFSVWLDPFEHIFFIEFLNMIELEFWHSIMVHTAFYHPCAVEGSWPRRSKFSQKKVIWKVAMLKKWMSMWMAMGMWIVEMQIWVCHVVFLLSFIDFYNKAYNSDNKNKHKKSNGVEKLRIMQSRVEQSRAEKEQSRTE